MEIKKRPETLRELLSTEEWWIVEDEFNIDKINFYETIFTVGNGYLGTRGALESTHTAAFPQTFLNGVFDHNDSTITHIVNVPDWIPLHIFANNERLCMQNSKILDFYRILDMRQGALYHFTRQMDSQGNITKIETLRYASFANQHICEMQIQITPENYSGMIVIQSEIDGHMFNLDRIPAYANMKNFDPEVKWEKWAKSKHLAHITSKTLDEKTTYLEMKTLDRPYRIGYASILNILNTKANLNLMCDYEHTFQIATINAKKGQTINCEKLVSIFSSREVDRSMVELSCYETITAANKQGFVKRFQDQQKAWNQKWDKSDVKIMGDEKANQALRFCMYHLLIAANEFDERANIGAKTLSGEGYKGHIFWDTEIFALPFFVFTQPKTARSLVLYRYNTLKGAKENAEATGYKGARYPWESADLGYEETPRWSADGKNRIWPGEEEIHITADVVRGVLSYFIATGDVNFMLDYGAEIVFETARFWASRLEYNSENDYYELSSVIGPDEFHEHVNNNVFTNWMARWNLQKAGEIYHWLKTNHNKDLEKLSAKINLESTEVDSWRDISKKIYILYNPETKLFEEFSGYFQLRDVPITKWDENGMPIYPEGLNDFNTGGTMLVKQADVVALLYILADEFSDDIIKTNFDFYEPRTMHSSSLSTSIHTIMAIATRDVEKALQYFKRTAFIDLYDIKNSTQDGIHMASAGGTWQAIISGFAGMRVINRNLTFKPWLPENWKGISFKLQWHGDEIDVTIYHKQAEFYWQTDKTETMTIELMGKKVVLTPQEKVTVGYTPEKQHIEIEEPEPQ